MLFPDHGSALIPYTEDTPDEVGEWPAKHAHNSLEGNSPTTGPGREGKEKMLWCRLHVDTWCMP